jgi:hypothetical protein
MGAAAVRPLRILAPVLALGLAFLFVAATESRQPGKDKDKDKDKDKKPPALPAVNPAQARLEQTISGLDGPAFDLAADDDLVAVACDRGTIQVLRKEAFKEIKAAKTETWKGHEGPVIALAYSGGPVLASAGADKKLIFWKVPEGKILQTVPVAARLRCLAMSKDGKWLASGDEDNAVQLWDVASAKPGPKLTDHKDWISCLAFSADGKQLASGSIDGSIRLWEVAGGKKTAELPFKAPPDKKTPPPDPIPVQSLAFAPDGKSLFYGTADGPIQVVNNPGDGKAVRTLAGHTAPVTAIRFHPSGNLMATSSKDRTILLWNPTQPQPLKKLEGHTAWVMGLAFVNQGQWLASAGADQTLRIWDLTEPKKK